jgi:hypothetical protein
MRGQWTAVVCTVSNSFALSHRFSSAIARPAAPRAPPKGDDGVTFVVGGR